MSNFAAILAVLANNHQDVEDIVQKFGGVGNVIRAAPSLIRIMQTVSSHADPVQETERVERVLAYSTETMDKVKAFQKSHGLPADGIIGNQTWRKIEELLAGTKK